MTMKERARQFQRKWLRSDDSLLAVSAAEFRAIRRETLEEAAKTMCSFCFREWPKLTEDDHRHRHPDGGSVPCESGRIRTLINEEIGKV